MHWYKASPHNDQSTPQTQGYPFSHNTAPFEFILNRQMIKGLGLLTGLGAQGIKIAHRFPLYGSFFSCLIFANFNNFGRNLLATFLPRGNFFFPFYYYYFLIISLPKEFNHFQLQKTILSCNIKKKKLKATCENLFFEGHEYPSCFGKQHEIWQEMAFGYGCVLRHPHDKPHTFG